MTKNQDENFKNTDPNILDLLKIIARYKYVVIATTLLVIILVIYSNNLKSSSSQGAKEYIATAVFQSASYLEVNDNLFQRKFLGFSQDLTNTKFLDNLFPNSFLRVRTTLLNSKLLEVTSKSSDSEAEAVKALKLLQDLLTKEYEGILDARKNQITIDLAVIKEDLRVLDAKLNSEKEVLFNISIPSFEQEILLVEKSIEQESLLVEKSMELESLLVEKSMEQLLEQAKAEILNLEEQVLFTEGLNRELQNSIIELSEEINKINLKRSDLNNNKNLKEAIPIKVKQVDLEIYLAQDSRYLERIKNNKIDDFNQTKKTILDLNHKINLLRIEMKVEKNSLDLNHKINLSRVQINNGIIQTENYPSNNLSVIEELKSSIYNHRIKLISLNKQKNTLVDKAKASLDSQSFVLERDKLALEYLYLDLDENQQGFALVDEINNRVNLNTVSTSLILSLAIIVGLGLGIIFAFLIDLIRRKSK